MKEVRPKCLSRLTERQVTGYLKQVPSRPILFGSKFRQLFDGLQLVFLIWRKRALIVVQAGLTIKAIVLANHLPIKTQHKLIGKRSVVKNAAALS